MNKSFVLVLLLTGIILFGEGDVACGLRLSAAEDQLSSCVTIDKPQLSEADRALEHFKFADAERLFVTMPPSDATLVGQLRAKIGQGQLSAALTLALGATKAHPHSALLLEGLAEVRFSRGELVDALEEFNQSIGIDPCLARAHYGLSLYLELSGMGASAQAQLDLAYRLSPHDPQIRSAWRKTQEPVPTPDSQIADLLEIKLRPSETAQQKAEIDSVISALRADKKGDCERVSATATTEIPLIPLFGDGKHMPPTGSALDVILNGKKRQLLIDTGGTGLMISRESAVGLGLKPEAEVSSSGVGDNGPSLEFIAHLDRMQIGSLEFRNCKIRVQTQAHGLNIQGLIGPDVLQSLLLTFDFPTQKLRTAALPVVRDGVSRDALSPTIAAAKRDRYISREMKDWTPVFRESQNLILSTAVGNLPQKLFILDTGAQSGLIAAEVAREVTTVESRPRDSLRGMSGVTHNVSITGPIVIAFPGFAGTVTEMTALEDLSGFAPENGPRISGVIGYDVLRHLIVSIDYRDNLVMMAPAEPAP